MGKESGTALQWVFHSATRFCDAAEKRKEKGEGGEAERLGGPRRPHRRLPPHCRPDPLLDSPPASRSQPGLPRRLPAQAPSRETPPVAARRARESPRTPSRAGGVRAPTQADTHNSAQTRMDRELSEPTWNPRDAPCARARALTLTHTHTHTHTHTKPAPETGRRERLAALQGRTSRSYSLVSLLVTLAECNCGSRGVGEGVIGSYLGR